MANSRITEKKLCDVRRAECTNPVFLAWVNSIGGVDHWLFEGDKKTDHVDGDHVTYEQAFEDLEDTRRIVSTARKNRIKRLVVQASSLKEDQFNGIMEIIASPEVQMLTNPTTWKTEGAKFEEVIIAPGTHSTQDIHGLKTITLTVVLQPVLTVES